MRQALDRRQLWRTQVPAPVNSPRESLGTGLRAIVLGRSRYKVTPASGKNIYNKSDPRNTWNGPIVKDETGEHHYHAYVPLYEPGSLGGPPSILHGVAENITGPWVSKKGRNLLRLQSVV